MPLRKAPYDCQRLGDALITSPNLRQRLVSRIHENSEPVLAELYEPFRGALLPEFSKLPYDQFSQAIPYRIPVVVHVLEDGVEQRQEVLTDFLVVRRGPPDVSRIFELGLVFFPTAVARYRADRYAVAFGPAVRVVGAIGVEGIIYRQVPDFAMVGECVFGVSVPVALDAVLSIEPAGSTAVRSTVGHGWQL